jgi:hypothetical protein
MRKPRHRHPAPEEPPAVFGDEDRNAWTVLLACTLAPACAWLVAALLF